MTVGSAPPALMLIDEASFEEVVLGARAVALVAFVIPGLRATSEVLAALEPIATSGVEVLAFVVDVDGSPGLAKRYRVEDAPVVVVLSLGAEVGRLAGPRRPIEYQIALESAAAATSIRHAC